MLQAARTHERRYGFSDADIEDIYEACKNRICGRICTGHTCLRCLINQTERLVVNRAICFKHPCQNTSFRGPQSTRHWSTTSRHTRKDTTPDTNRIRFVVYKVNKGQTDLFWMLPNLPSAFSIMEKPVIVADKSGLVYYADLANAYAPTEVWTWNGGVRACSPPYPIAVQIISCIVSRHELCIHTN